MNVRRALDAASSAEQRAVLLYNEALLLMLQGQRPGAIAGLPPDLARDLPRLHLPR